MKTNNLTLIGVGVILIAAVMVSFLMSRSSVLVQKRDMPIFMGEEVVINKVPAVEVANGSPAKISASKAIAMPKVVSTPVPQPKVVTPLPIMPPRISYRVLPQYPMSALQKGLEGTTILSIYVGLSGSPEKIEVKSSSGVTELDQSAVAAVSQWKFNPATQGSSALASWFEVPIRFEVK